MGNGESNEKHEQIGLLEEKQVAGDKVIVGPVIGRVTNKSARILIEFDNEILREFTVILTSEIGKHDVHSISKLCEARRPNCFTFKNLQSSTRYQVSIRDIDCVKSSFQTRAEDGSLNSTNSHKIAVVSSNNFEVTEAIEGHKPSLNLWRDLYRKAKDLDLLLHIGNQVIAEHPFQQDLDMKDDEGSIFQKNIRMIERMNPRNWPDTAEKIRESYRNLYRRTWGSLAQRMVMANVPNLMIANELEFANNWGDNELHRNENSPEWFVGMQAHIVMMDYQRQLWDNVLQTSEEELRGDHYYELYGDLCVLFLDCRNGRAMFYRDSPRYPYLGDYQWKNLDTWLTTGGVTDDVRLLLVVNPCHLAYISEEGHYGSYIEERSQAGWTYQPHSREQRMLLEALFAWKVSFPNREILICSGGSHVGCHVDFLSKKGEVVKEFVSGPIAHDYRSSKPVKVVEKVSWYTQFDYLRKKFDYEITNFVPENNYGFVEINPFDEQAPVVKCQLIGSGAAGVRQYLQLASQEQNNDEPKKEDCWTVLCG